MSLFNILIENRGVNVCVHHLIALSSEPEYKHVLAHLNTFASHANVTESRTVALVAMQPLN